MDDLIITWNVTNWITICLMAVVGYLIVTAAIKGFQSMQGGSSSTS